MIHGYLGLCFFSVSNKVLYLKSYVNKAQNLEFFPKSFLFYQIQIMLFVILESCVFMVDFGHSGPISFCSWFGMMTSSKVLDSPLRSIRASIDSYVCSIVWCGNRLV